LLNRVQWGHVFSRGLEYVLTFFIILTVNFFLPRFMPGGPLLSILGSQNADLPVVIDEETKYKLMDYYHLNDPLHLQFVHYLRDAVHLDFGYSISYNIPVLDVVLGRLPWTLLLMGTALLLSTMLGIFLGLESSWKRGKESTAYCSSLYLYSVPCQYSFWGHFLFSFLGTGWVFFLFLEP